MGFALELNEQIRERESQVQSEVKSGDALGLILSRYLLAVESQSDKFILTSILLVDGPVLRHGAAPSLPKAYTALIDGLEYGPCAGSCGTAAYRGRPVYVTDIANDPLWDAYREYALLHGLRACWSTPIKDDAKNVIGTFAVYHTAPGAPSQEEIDAIKTITDSVSRAIQWSLESKDLAGAVPNPGAGAKAEKEVG
jgi:GAF domain-containing protein